MEDVLLRLTTVVMVSVRLKRVRIAHPVQRIAHVLAEQRVNQMVNACLLNTVVMGFVRNLLEKTVPPVRRTVRVKNMKCVFREDASLHRFVEMENVIPNLWRIVRYVQVIVTAMPMKSVLRGSAVNQNVRTGNVDPMGVGERAEYVLMAPVVKMESALPLENVVMEGV